MLNSVFGSKKNLAAAGAASSAVLTPDAPHPVQFGHVNAIKFKSGRPPMVDLATSAGESWTKLKPLDCGTTVTIIDAYKGKMNKALDSKKEGKIFSRGMVQQGALCHWIYEVGPDESLKQRGPIITI